MSALPDEKVWQQIRAGRGPSVSLVDDLAQQDAVRLGARGVDRARRAWGDEVLGAGPLEEVMADPQVTDVLVNGTEGVWVDRGRGLERLDIELGDDTSVRRLAVRLAGLAGRRLDETSPWVDGLLDGGVRLHAVLPPLVEGGPHISLRVPRRTVPTLEDLAALGSIDEVGLTVLRAVVSHRLAFVVSGGTGSGKTTLLAALLGLVDPAERIVIVEDVREIGVAHPHVVRMQSRSPNVEGRGLVDMATLVRQSLRMRPDRVVVGEVRGAEVRDLLSALNTGHEGGCGTVHANAVTDVVTRFEALGALAGMSPEAVRTQLGSALECVLHVRREPAGRVLAQVGVVERGEGSTVRVRLALHRRGGRLRAADAWPVLAHRLGLPQEVASW